MFQTEQLSILIVTLSLCILFVYIGHSIQKLKENETPKGFILTVILFVKALNKITIDNMGEKHGRVLSAYIGSVFIYLLVSNYSGLLGLSPPTSNYSVTIALALVTWVMIQVTKIRANGFGGYLKGFFEPFFLFVIPNVFATVAPLISLSLRMFGNILSGSVIMWLVYTFTGWLSGFVPVVGSFNFVSLFVAPWLHLYFDLFSGFLQAFLFISLTTVFIAIEFNDNEEVNYG